MDLKIESVVLKRHLSAAVRALVLTMLTEALSKSPEFNGVGPLINCHMADSRGIC